MIEGLVVTIDSNELVTICAKRAEDRRSKAASYRANAAAFTEMDMPKGMTSQRDPKVDMLEAALRYEGEAQELDFIRTHLEVGQTYRLESQDLRKLGIVSQGW